MKIKREILQIISKVMLEWFDVDICWGHSSEGYHRTQHTWNTWNTEVNKGYHCTSCGIILVGTLNQENLGKLQQQWDVAVNAYRASFKGKRATGEPEP